jgi:hypothetical protein
MRTAHDRDEPNNIAGSFPAHNRIHDYRQPATHAKEISNGADIEPIRGTATSKRNALTRTDDAAAAAACSEDWS